MSERQLFTRHCSEFPIHAFRRFTVHGSRMDNLIAANVRQRPVRALVSAAGVALGVCLVMLFTGLARGLSNDLERRSQNLKAEIVFTRDAGSTQLMSTTTNLSVKYAEEL